MIFRMDTRQFDRLVEEAIAALPPDVRGRVDEVVIEVRPRATQEQLDEQGIGPDEDLLGLFDGVSDLERGIDDSGVLPSRIFLFQEPIEADAETEDQIREEIRRTLWHELAHGLGFDDGELHRMEEERGWR